MAVNKIYKDADAALADLLRDGMTIMSGGFGLCGNAEACIDAIARSRVKNLTIISNNCGNQGQGLAVLLKNRQVSRVICSFVGGNPDLADLYMKGLVKVELSPQGTFAERIRAGGAGIAGFYTPTGVGTVVAEGKEVREIDGKKHVFERPLRADIAIVRAAVGDIDRMRSRVAAPSGDLPRDSLGGFRGTIEDRDPRSRSRESAAGCGADPVPAAGDEGNFSGKLTGHLFHLHYRNSSSKAFASFKSGVSNPSVNQP